MKRCNNRCDEFEPVQQNHTHECEESTKISELSSAPHNHRFAVITGEAIASSCGGHYHTVECRTDFYEDHYHILTDKTGPAICVGNGKHVHFVDGVTNVEDCHRHKYQFTTLINDPIGCV